MLTMIGVDYKTAGIELREKLSLTVAERKLLLTQLRNLPGINGAALISTCNRTELYLSCDEVNEWPESCREKFSEQRFHDQKHIDKNIREEELQELFGEAFGCTITDLEEHIYIKNEEEVILYLFEVACGIHSMIFGDDQISSQVGEAIELANEAGASDSVLNTLFRHAVTCAKRVKTSVTLKSISPSVASMAADILQDYLCQNENRKALVIGNGEIGRIISKLLVAAGCEVYMTLRSYKYKQNVVPKGCRVIEYENRTKLFPEVNILISATKSPHHTVSYEAVLESGQKPDYIMDLALPRDIDPRVGEIEGVNYYDIDTIGKKALYDNNQEIAVMKEIITSQLEKFNEWMVYHKISQKRLFEESVKQNHLYT